jgi:hypothetical protein
MSADTNRHWSTRRTRIVPTAPPSVRFSRRTVLDEASRPTAPEPAPEVSFTARGIAVGRHLVDVHDHYRGELRELQGLLDRVTRGVITAGQARGELNRFALRANNWALGGVCQRQCVSFAEHHTAEDGSIFPHLRSRQHSLSCPGFCGGRDFWESWGSWHQGSVIPLSCGNARWRWSSS